MSHHGRPTTTRIWEDAASASELPPGPPPDLIDKALFIAAIESIQGKKEGMSDEEQKMFAIGKTSVALNIQTSPGLDLSESPINDVVVVSGVEGNAKDAGILMGDTIMKISVNTDTGAPEFKCSTKGLNLQELIGVIQAAAVHAINNGLVEIDIELNRLVKLRYA